VVALPEHGTSGWLSPKDLWRPPEQYAQGDCQFLEKID
jgi:hypothetical protein